MITKRELVVDADKVRERMAALDITHTALSETIGFSRMHFWRLLNNKTSPRLDDVTKLAQALDVDPSEIITVTQANDSN